MQKQSDCLKVAKTYGEKTLTLAKKFGVIDRKLQIHKDENGFLCIPILRKLNENELSLLKKQITEFQIVNGEFLEKKQPEKTLNQILADKLPQELIDKAPRSLDIIGDIAVVEIPPELEHYGKLIGEAILKAHKNLKVVLAKAGAISGIYRLRDFEYLAGQKRTNTMYKENGCIYHVDLAKAYFSPRLSHEHQRVASQVQECEMIVDLFAGVGPFAIPIAKNVKNVRVYAIDINNEAVELLKKNIQINQVEKKVHAINGDARTVIKSRFSGRADRVIMNLPESSKEFIDVACEAIKSSGGIINYYSFVHLPETIEVMTKEFSDRVEKSGRHLQRILQAKPVRETAPYEWQVVLDAAIC
jgi:tRNA (guanine37-N1)-methyltransferase